VTELKSAKIVQAVALFDEKSAIDYGLALWAALLEAEKFYRRAGAEIEYRRFYFAPSPPSSSFFEKISKQFGKFVPGQPMKTALDFLRDEQIRSSTDTLTSVPQGPRRIYDQRILANVVRHLVDPQTSGDHLMIITDQSIIPPKKWRYIIWESDEKTSVISAAPLDPEYWRDKDPNRVQTIKTRTRNAVLSIVGSLIGLERCENPTCFQYNDVDSVTVLDEMQSLGPEHGLDKLAGYGFEDMVSDPTAIQPPIPHSMKAR
jgi:predicted Zn-dependent protease